MNCSCRSRRRTYPMPCTGQTAMRDIKPLYEGIKIVGKAVTVQTFQGDWSKPVEASDVAQKGEIIVIYNGSNDIAPWGELASHGCQQKGIAGVVIDGAIRDVDDISRIKFPSFCVGAGAQRGRPEGIRRDQRRDHLRRPEGEAGRLDHR